MRKSASGFLLALVAAISLAAGCSTAGRAGRSAYVEGHLVGTWTDKFGQRYSYSADGAWTSSAGQTAAYHVTWPFLEFTFASGQKSTFSIEGYDFDANPQTLTVKDSLGNLQTLTK